MLLFIPTSCLLLLLCLLPASDGRAPSTLQGDEQLDREDQVARTPKEEPGKKISVLQLSDDNDHTADADGEYTHAHLTKPGMPRDFTLCIAFRVETWYTEFTGSFMYVLKDKNGKSWSYIMVGMGSPVQHKTIYAVSMGKVWFEVKTDSLLFPTVWTRMCLSNDAGSGRVRLAVDGKIWMDEIYPDALEEDVNRPLDLDMDVGYRSRAPSLEFVGEFVDLNIFSSALSTTRMIALTQAGSAECGSPGDFLNWAEPSWQKFSPLENASDSVWYLHSQARLMDVEELDGPCHRQSVYNVFTVTFKAHSDCMHHCQKIGQGRSPPVRRSRSRRP